MAEIMITNDNYEAAVLQSDTPVLLDFWADWCGPCRMLSPIVSQIAEDWAGKVKVGKVNVDEQPELADRFGVNSIPMLVLMKNGSIVKSSVGYQSKNVIEEMLNSVSD